jgi:hypothetical protein
VHVVPHTHWDREWHLPFQTFRMRLVDVLDDLLGRMRRDPSYARFLLDGQLAVVDDYLAVRPEAAGPLRDLVASGRLSIGPWYTLPDELLVSGETVIRNLQLGLRTAASYGGAMEVGYLPDTFGHVAQMPQILRQLGFDDAVVWRGVPAAVDRTGFWWEAPDGSTVRAEYLPQGYGNGAALPEDATSLIAQVTEFGDLWSGLLGDDAPILWMNGADHMAPAPWLGRVIAEANDLAAGEADAEDRLELVVASLTDHLAAAPREGLPRWRGELRSGSRANLLMGVTSNRVDIRRAAAGAERALERLAEPLSALLLPAERWPHALLDEAWRNVVLNAAHDSVCGCSADVVCDAVLHRYGEATQIAEGLTERALAHLGARVAHDGPVVVNPTARPRSGLVELTLPGDQAPPGTQLVGAQPAEQVALKGPASLVVAATEEVEWDASITGFSLEAADGTVLVDADRAGALVGSAVRAELVAVGESRDPDEGLRLRVRRHPTVTVLAQVDDVAGLGWKGWTPAADAGGGAAPTAEPVRAETLALDNGRVRVEVDTATGTFTVNGHGGLGRLVDGGDCGDTYNWCPPAHDTIVDGPESVDVRVVERGPLRARMAIRARYRWPERAEGLERRIGGVDHLVITNLELRTGEAFVRAEVVVANRSRDHRLRLHLPLPEPADRSRAECAFAVVERGLATEGGPTEAALPTHPAKRFVRAGGLTVVHEGITEYELVDIHDVDGTDGEDRAHELALTVLRCTGLLSQGPMATRALRAGPSVPVEGAQLQRQLTFRFALAIDNATNGVDPYALADDVLVPLQTAEGSAAGGDLPAEGRALGIEGAEVSAVRREGGGLRVRVFNPTSEARTVRVAGHDGWLVDLRDRPVAPFSEEFSLRPHGLATLVL